MRLIVLRVRYWLIRKLAGRRAVMLNFRIFSGQRECWISTSPKMRANVVPRFRERGMLIGDCFFHLNPEESGKLYSLGTDEPPWWVRLNSLSIPPDKVGTT